MVVHRLLEPPERDLALDLWTSVFEVDRPFFESLIHSAGDQGNLTVGTFDGDRLVSTVHVFTRWQFDDRGEPVKVGAVGSVATDPAHRRNGYSGRLLEMAIEHMKRRGFAWSLLFTGANDHYARYGWFDVPSPSWHGRLATPTGPTLATRHHKLDLQEMATVYQQSQNGRPLAHKRTPQAWHHAVAHRIGKTGTTFFAVRGKAGDLLGYAVSGCRREENQVVEACALPENEAEVLEALFGAAASHFRDRGHDRAIASVPRAEPYASAVRTLIEEPEIDWGGYAMARSLDSRFPQARLRAMFDDPKAHHWLLDNF